MGADHNTGSDGRRHVGGLGGSPVRNGVPSISRNEASVATPNYGVAISNDQARALQCAIDLAGSAPVTGDLVAVVALFELRLHDAIAAVWS
jgi:hypothetical protein